MAVREEVQKEGHVVHVIALEVHDSTPLLIEVRTLRQFLESDQVIDCDCSNYWLAPSK